MPILTHYIIPHLSRTGCTSLNKCLLKHTGEHRTQRVAAYDSSSLVVHALYKPCLKRNPGFIEARTF